MAHMCHARLHSMFLWAGKCAGEKNGSTIDSIVLAKVARGRSSPRTTKNADWVPCRVNSSGPTKGAFCESI